MTTPTLTPAAIAAEARTVLHTVLPLLEAMPVPAVFPVIAAAWNLDRALNGYEALASGRIHWTSVSDVLSAGPEPEYDALMKAAQEADDAADALVRAIAAHGGTEVALSGAGVK